MNAQATFAAPGVLVLEVNDAMSEEGVVDVSGTFTGLTVAVEGSTDGGTTWRALAMSPVAGGADVTSVTAAGAWRSNFGGFNKARVNVSAIATGSVVVKAQVSRKAA